MDVDAAKDADRFLSFLLEGSAFGSKESALDANAFWIGGKLGFSPEITTAAVRSLVDKGLLHAREVESVILVHPTKAALDQKNNRQSAFSNVMALIFGNKRGDEKV